MSTTDTVTNPQEPAPAAARSPGGQGSLFPGIAPAWTFTTGVLPRQDIAILLEDGSIAAATEILPRQLQPASLDLRLGPRAHRVPASFLPGPRSTVREKLERLTMHTLDLTEGACLEAGCTYVIPLEESFRLPRDTSGITTPKSTTGRLDVFTRLITDHATAFERIPAGYTGPSYVEVTPRTFSVIARRGDSLNQVRLRRGNPKQTNAFHERVHSADPLAFGGNDGASAGVIEDASLVLSVDLVGTEPGRPVVYRARRFAREAIDLRNLGHYPWERFWEAIPGPLTNGLILRPDEFYIMATKERVRVPRNVSAEMVAYDTAMGEFRVHYAGFFDPGFGDHDADLANGIEPGTRAVLEVRSHDTPVLLEDGQRIGRLVYERLVRTPDVLYGSGLGSSYARQGVKLAKQFRA